MGNRYLYIVFSSTPYRMGKFIRLATRHRYNHVSLSLDPELKNLYSFARHYKDTPFYGGFVKESSLRYRNSGECANVKICAIPITDSQLEEIHSYLEEMRGRVYNMISAVFSPLHKKVSFNGAFTCVEFAVDFLIRFAPQLELENRHFYSIKDLEGKTTEYTIYKGAITDYAPDTSWGEDTFPIRKGLWSRTQLTLTSNGKLIYFLVKGFRA